MGGCFIPPSPLRTFTTSYTGSLGRAADGTAGAADAGKGGGGGEAGKPCKRVLLAVLLLWEVIRPWGWWLVVERGCSLPWEHSKTAEWPVGDTTGGGRVEAGACVQQAGRAHAPAGLLRPRRWLAGSSGWWCLVCSVSALHTRCPNTGPALFSGVVSLVLCYTPTALLAWLY